MLSKLFGAKKPGERFPADAISLAQGSATVSPPSR